MASTVLIRAHPDKYTVSEPFARMRRGEPAIGTRKMSHYTAFVDAARDAMDRLTAPSTDEPADDPHGPLAQTTEGLMDKRWEGLRPQCREAARLMRENGGLTVLEAMHAGIGCLTKRVADIRARFGDGCIETLWVSNGRSRYARYVWRGVGS